MYLAFVPNNLCAMHVCTEACQRNVLVFSTEPQEHECLHE